MLYRSVAVACCGFEETFLTCAFCFCHFRPRGVHLGILLLLLSVRVHVHKTIPRVASRGVKWKRKAYMLKKSLFFIVISAIISISERN